MDAEDETSPAPAEAARGPEAGAASEPEAAAGLRPEPGEPAGTKRRQAGRGVRRLADVLLIAGGLLLAYPFWSAGYAQVQQARLDSAYKEESAAFVDEAARTVAARSTADVRTKALPKAEVVRRLAALYGRQLKPGDPVGHLRIPKLGLDRLVQHGAGGRASLDPASDRALLRKGPVHYGITPLPGAGEPFAVSGHRTTYGAPFHKLDELEQGDTIYVQTPYAKFRYLVAKTSVVRPDETGVLFDRGYGLVLTTCTPPYSASHRLIVWAKLKSVTPSAKLGAQFRDR
jgi:sortase A